MRWGYCLILLASGAFVAQPVLAQGPGRYCERQSALCWHCADIVFPAETPCAEPEACSTGELCVDHDGPTCLTPLQFCCAVGECETPPGCGGAGSACGDEDGDGTADTCTFLNACPPGGVPVNDAGVSDAGAMDAGLSDSGVTDSGLSDSGPPNVDAGTQDGAKSDTGQSPDAGLTPITTDSGCDCSTTAPSTPIPLLAIVLFAALRRTQRQRP